MAALPVSPAKPPAKSKLRNYQIPIRSHNGMAKMPTLRLKIKLVFAITGMVLAIVATISTLYISEVVHQRVQQTASDGEVIANEIYTVARNTLETDLSNTRVDLND